MSHRPALKSTNVLQMVVFEWTLLAYELYLFGSVIYTNHYQPRMLAYCVFFLLFDKLDLAYRYFELEDPLHLSAIINCIRYMVYLCICNLSLLLVRIVIDNQNVHAFIVVMHYLLIMALFLNDFSKRGMKLDINVDSNNIFSKFVTPLSMFIFNRTCELNELDFWSLELVIFGINLFISSELNRILLMKECQYFGWASLEDVKDKTTWNKRRALKAIIVVCCVMIVVQNLLLIFDKLKYSISVTIVHTFIVSITAYLLYVGYLPLRK